MIAFPKAQVKSLMDALSDVIDESGDLVLDPRDVDELIEYAEQANAILATQQKVIVEQEDRLFDYEAQLRAIQKIAEP